MLVLIAQPAPLPEQPAMKTGKSQYSWSIPGLPSKAPMPPIAAYPQALSLEPMQTHISQQVKVRQHRASAQIGRVDWSVKGLRRRIDAFSASGSDSLPAAKSWLVSTELGWAVGNSDRVFLGGNYTVDRRSTVIVTSQHLHASTYSRIAEIGWDHGQNMRLTVGYTSSGGQTAPLLLARAIDVANGVAVHESGMQATATKRMQTGWHGTDVVIGARVVRATVPTDERLLGAASGKFDNRLALLLRAQF